MPEGEEQHRGGIGVRRGHAREGVLGARAVLHGEHADGVAVGDAAIAVGDAGPDTLLPAEVWPYARRGAGFDDRGRWVTTEELHAFPLENLGDGIDDFHALSSL